MIYILSSCAEELEPNFLARQSRRACGRELMVLSQWWQLLLRPWWEHTFLFSSKNTDLSLTSSLITCVCVWWWSWLWEGVTLIVLLKLSFKKTILNVKEFRKIYVKGHYSQFGQNPPLVFNISMQIHTRTQILYTCIVDLKKWALLSYFDLHQGFH